MKRPRLLFLLVPAVSLTMPLLLPLAGAAAPPKKPAARQRSTGPAKRPGTARQAARKKQAPARVRTQQQPEPARIREIQQALAARGYAVEPTGVWDAATVEALKKFQEDHNINNLSGRGRLDPLTLIALGLGPQQGRPAPPGAAAPQSNTEGNQQ